MDIYRSSNVYIESKVGLLTELKAIEPFVTGEVGEVISGKLSVPEDSKPIVFQSMGSSIEDAAMANMIYQKFINDF